METVIRLNGRVRYSDWHGSWLTCVEIDMGGEPKLFTDAAYYVHVTYYRFIEHPYKHIQHHAKSYRLIRGPSAMVGSSTLFFETS